MPADASGFVAGHYTGTYNSLDVGTTEQGFMIDPVFHREDIRTDDFGDTIVDGIYRGYNLRISFELIRWSAAARDALMFPFDATLGTLAGIGQTIVGSFAKSLVLTPVSGINSNAKTYTFPLCVADGNHGGFNLNTRTRRARCNLLVFPHPTTGVLFTVSA